MIIETKLPLNSTADRVAFELITAYEKGSRAIKPIRLFYDKTLEQVGLSPRDKLYKEVILDITDITAPIFFKTPLYGNMKAIFLFGKYSVHYYRLLEPTAMTQPSSKPVSYIAFGPKPLAKYIPDAFLNEYLVETPYSYRNLKMYQISRNNQPNIVYSLNQIIKNLFIAIDLF